jgi:hypothetical protein
MSRSQAFCVCRRALAKLARTLDEEDIRDLLALVERARRQRLADGGQRQTLRRAG